MEETQEHDYEFYRRLYRESQTDLAAARAEIERLRGHIAIAARALRMYEYGNPPPDLAKEVADLIEPAPEAPHA